MMNTISILVRRRARAAWATSLAVALAWSLATLPLQAQPTSTQTRTLVVQNGAIYIDGQHVAAERLPADLNLQGLDVHFSFSGGGTPVVELNGTRYVLEQNRLRVLSPAPAAAPDDITVVFRDQERRGRSGAAEASPYQPERQEDAADEALPLAAEQLPLDEVLEEARALEVQARRLQEQNGAHHEAEQLGRQAAAIRMQAERAVELARELPRLEVEQYFDEVRRQDRDLFNRLQHEWQMEAETVQLGQQIRQAAHADQRVALTEQLRNRLDEIFELKQENRRREIYQLERQLDALRSRLQERERLRQQIVNQRVGELIGRPPDAPRR